MTSPRNQYWRRIVPVVGEPIPDGAEWASDPQTWNPFGGPAIFNAADIKLEWRVPVPVVPVTAAVELVAKLLRHGFRGVFNVNGDMSLTHDMLTDSQNEVAKLQLRVAQLRNALERVVTYDHEFCTTPEDLRGIARVALEKDGD